MYMLLLLEINCEKVAKHQQNIVPMNTKIGGIPMIPGSGNYMPLIMGVDRMIT